MNGKHTHKYSIWKSLSSYPYNIYLPIYICRISYGFVYLYIFYSKKIYLAANAIKKQDVLKISIFFGKKDQHRTVFRCLEYESQKTEFQSKILPVSLQTIFSDSDCDLHILSHTQAYIGRYIFKKTHNTYSYIGAIINML